MFIPRPSVYASLAASSRSSGQPTMGQYEGTIRLPDVLFWLRYNVFLHKMRWSNPPGMMSTDLDYTKHSSAIDCTRGIQNNQKTVSAKIEERTINLFFVRCVLAFVRWRLFTPVHLNIGVMRGATFLPVSPHFLTDKGIRIFTPNVATRADLAPSRQYLFHFHLRHLSLSEKVHKVFSI